jgi:hypothetical protein
LRLVAVDFLTGVLELGTLGFGKFNLASDESFGREELEEVDDVDPELVLFAAGFFAVLVVDVEWVVGKGVVRVVVVVLVPALTAGSETGTLELDGSVLMSTV